MFHFFSSSCSVMGNDTRTDYKQYLRNLVHCYQSMFLVNLAVCGRLSKFTKTHIFDNNIDEYSFCNLSVFFYFSLHLCA
jgi:hypothetical protein